MPTVPNSAYLFTSAERQAQAALNALATLQTTKQSLLTRLRARRPRKTPSEANSGPSPTPTDEDLLVELVFPLVECMLAEQMVGIEVRASLRRAREWQRKRIEWAISLAIFVGAIYLLRREGGGF